LWVVILCPAFESQKPKTNSNTLKPEKLKTYFWFIKSRILLALIKCRQSLNSSDVNKAWTCKDQDKDKD